MRVVPVTERREAAGVGGHLGAGGGGLGEVDLARVHLGGAHDVPVEVEGVDRPVVGVGQGDRGHGLPVDRRGHEVPGPGAGGVGAGDPAQLPAAPGQAAQELQVRRALEQRVAVGSVAGGVVLRVPVGSREPVLPEDRVGDLTIGLA